MALIQRIRAAQEARLEARAEDAYSEASYEAWLEVHTCDWCGRQANDVQNGWCPSPRSNDPRHGDIWD